MPKSAYHRSRNYKQPANIDNNKIKNLDLSQLNIRSGEMRTFQKTQVTSGGLIFLGPGHFGLNIRNLLQYRHSEQELL